MVHSIIELLCFRVKYRENYRVAVEMVSEFYFNDASSFWELKQEEMFKNTFQSGFLSILYSLGCVLV